MPSPLSSHPNADTCRLLSLVKGIREANPDKSDHELTPQYMAATGRKKRRCQQLFERLNKDPELEASLEATEAPPCPLVVIPVVPPLSTPCEPATAFQEIHFGDEPQQVAAETLPSTQEDLDRWEQEEYFSPAQYAQKLQRLDELTTCRSETAAMNALTLWWKMYKERRKFDGVSEKVEFQIGG